MNAMAEYKTAEGISLAELASRLGVKSKGNLSDVIAGNRDISVSMAKKLSPLCGRPWKDLISG